MFSVWLITSALGAVIAGTIAYQTTDRYTPWYLPAFCVLFGFLLGPLICGYALAAALWWAYSNVRIAAIRAYPLRWEAAMKIDLKGWALVQRPGYPRPSVFGTIAGENERTDHTTGFFMPGHRVVSTCIESHNLLTRPDGAQVGMAITETGTHYRLLDRHPSWDGHSIVTEEEALSWPRV